MNFDSAELERRFTTKPDRERVVVVLRHCALRRHLFSAHATYQDFISDSSELPCWSNCSNGSIDLRRSRRSSQRYPVEENFDDWTYSVRTQRQHSRLGGGFGGHPTAPAQAGEIDRQRQGLPVDGNSLCAYSGLNDTPDGLSLPIGPGGSLVEIDPGGHVRPTATLGLSRTSCQARAIPRRGPARRFRQRAATRSSNWPLRKGGRGWTASSLFGAPINGDEHGRHYLLRGSGSRRQRAALRLCPQHRRSRAARFQLKPSRTSATRSRPVQFL